MEVIVLENGLMLRASVLERVRCRAALGRGKSAETALRDEVSTRIQMRESRLASR